MATHRGSAFVLAILLTLTIAAASQFKVGGSGQWTSPNPNSMSYNDWAERTRFQVGDTLLFSYPPDKDSVLLVDQNAYNSCDTSSFIDQFKDGSTAFTFARSGPFYFISGNKDNCKKDEKLIVMVMVGRNGRTSLIAPSPSPSLPPSTSTASSPPPKGQIEVSPSTSPPSPPPPSGASSQVVGFMSTLGAAIVASLFYVL
ncbi:early nodulin-like protein 1 [Ananas comosus]|uniref:Early nodulin-like protein 1 n=1 Tax=Ananas comosus TaxID=4615 RepID=A0A6P5EUX6_ANACO|nr:early nodulin-like protein 1 [Ananas comosus]